MSTLPLRVAALLALLLALLSGCDAHAEDKAAIRLTMRQIEDANLASDGQMAASLFTAKSIERYPRLIQLAIHGTRSQLEALDAWDLDEVLRIRLLGNRKDYENLGAREYVAYATSKGWYVLPDYEYVELDRIAVNGDTGSAREVYTGEATGFRLRFERENGVWKFDEESWRQGYNDTIAELADDEGLTIAEYLLAELEASTGKTAPPDIWGPAVNPVGAFNPRGNR